MQDLHQENLIQLNNINGNKLEMNLDSKHHS